MILSKIGLALEARGLLQVCVCVFLEACSPWRNHDPLVFVDGGVLSDLLVGRHKDLSVTMEDQQR